jgi:hypothetical protein
MPLRWTKMSSKQLKGEKEEQERKASKQPALRVASI